MTPVYRMSKALALSAWTATVSRDSVKATLFVEEKS